MDARGWTRCRRSLGLEEGDAHVIRNAGGVVTDDEIRSLAISQNLLGTEEIVLIHHTDCGMLKFTDEEFKRQLEEDFGQRPGLGPGRVRRPRGQPARLDRAGSRRARSSRTRTRSAASSTRSRPGGCARSADRAGRARRSAADFHVPLPSIFAWASARSARSNSSVEFAAWVGKTAQPALALSSKPSSASAALARRTHSNSRSASRRMPLSVTPLARIANSSPPRRATMSLPRAASRRASAAAHSTRSPPVWPNSVLASLKSSRSTSSRPGAVTGALAGHRRRRARPRTRAGSRCRSARR